MSIVIYFSLIGWCLPSTFSKWKLFNWIVYNQKKEEEDEKKKKTEKWRIEKDWCNHADVLVFASCGLCVHVRCSTVCVSVILCERMSVLLVHRRGQHCTLYHWFHGIVYRKERRRCEEYISFQVILCVVAAGANEQKKKIVFGSLTENTKAKNMSTL